MLKKTIIFFLCFCISPVFVSGDTGPSQFYDKDDRLTFSISTNQTEVAIGETLEFTLELRNRTYETITMEKSRWYPHAPSSIDIDLDGVVVEPGKRVAIDISYPVTDTVKWYEKDGEFYMDINLTLDYVTISSFMYDGDYYEDEYTYFEKVQAKPIPIKITNLYDGSEFINFELLTNRNVFGTWGSYSNYENVPDVIEAYITNNIAATNTSEAVLSDFSFYNMYDGSIKERDFDLKNGDRCWTSTSNRYVYSRASEVPEYLDAVYRAKFNIDGKYYAVEKQISCGVASINTPEIESRLVQTEPDEAGNIAYTINIKNKSEKTVFGFYLVEGNQNLSVFDAGNYVGNIEPGEKVERTFIIKEGEPVEIYWGSQANHEIRFYGQYILNGGKKIDIDAGSRGYYSETVETDQAQYSSQIYYNPAKRPVTATPTATPEVSQMPEVSKVPEPTVTPTQITIENVEVKSGIPVWVWAAVPSALILAVGAVIILRKKEKKL